VEVALRLDQELLAADPKAGVNVIGGCLPPEGIDGHRRRRQLALDERSDQQLADGAL
jgi:hypothetical protein